MASDAVELIAQGKVQLVVNTPRGLGPRADGSTSARPRWSTRCPASPRWPRRGPPPPALPTRVRTCCRCAPSRISTRPPRGRHSECRSRLAPGGNARHERREHQPSQSGADGIGDVRARCRALRVRRAERAGRRRGQVALGGAVGGQRRRHGCTRSEPACSTASACRARGWRRGWRTIFRRCTTAGARVVVSIWGRSVADYAKAAELVAVAASSGAGSCIAALEVNVSCPNVEDRSRMFAHSAEATAEVLAATACGLPRWAKLSPNVPDVVEIAHGAVAGGADGLTLVNTLLGLALDVESGRPVLGAGGGGLSGGPVHPVAVRAVWECRSAFPELPIVGVGGVFLGPRSGRAAGGRGRRRAGRHGDLQGPQGALEGAPPTGPLVRHPWHHGRGHPSERACPRR